DIASERPCPLAFPHVSGQRLVKARLPRDEGTRARLVVFEIPLIVTDELVCVGQPIRRLHAVEPLREKRDARCAIRLRAVQDVVVIDATVDTAIEPKLVADEVPAEVSCSV